MSVSVEILATLVVVVCAVFLTVPSSDWSLSNVGYDVKLYFFAIVACWMSFRFRVKPPVREESVPSVQHDADHFDVTKHVELMQKYAWERNIGGAMNSFQLIKQSGSRLSSLMFNTVLQACVNCGNVQAAEEWMDEMKVAGMVDESSFGILIKALVAAHTLEKANKVLLRDAKSAGVRPSVAAFDDLLCGFARENRFNEAYTLLEEMHTLGVQPTRVTLNAIVKLINSSRNVRQPIMRVEKLLRRNGCEAHLHGGAGPWDYLDSLMPVPSPYLSGVISKAKRANNNADHNAHEIRVTGRFHELKAARRTLKQLGFLNKPESGGGPLDGHWETDRGLTVVIEGKTVRWSARHASRLRYTQGDRCACVLPLYGESTHGHLEAASHASDGAKVLRWDNGDTWYPCDGRAVGHHILFSQTMTKTLRDATQDRVYRARAIAVLKCVSKQCLHMPSVFEDAITQFLGNDLYYISIHFESRWNPSQISEDEEELPLFDASTDICVMISRRHPRIGLRHCWADRDDSLCGQRTWVNGEELDEYCFCRHVGTVYWA